MGSPKKVEKLPPSGFINNGTVIKLSNTIETAINVSANIDGFM